MRSSFENADGEDGSGDTKCVLYWSVQRRKSDDRSDRDPRVVPRSRRGLGEAGGDHRRQPGPRCPARPRVLACRRIRGARRPHREGPEGGRRDASRAVPGAQRRRDGRGLQRGGGRRHGDRMGRRRRVDLQRGDLADRGRPARDRRLGLAAGPRGEPHRCLPRGPRRCPGDARGRATDLHGLGPRRAAAQGTGCVQCLESRVGRHGQGPGARSGPRRHHGERRCSGVVRFPVGRRVEEQPRALGGHHRAHGATALGSARRTWPAPISSWPPTRRPSSPAPCSTSTADTCWYDDAATGRGDHRSRRCPRRGAVTAVRQRARHRPRAERCQCAFTRGDRRRTPPNRRVGRDGAGGRERLHHDVLSNHRKMAKMVSGHQRQALIHGLLRTHADHRAGHDLVDLVVLEGWPIRMHLRA